MDKLLERDRVAEMLCVPASTLANWASEGKGPAFFKVGRHARYREADVLAWLEGQRRTPEAGDRHR